MNEKILSIESYPALEIYGANDMFLNQIRQLFPRLKILARGDLLKLNGERNDITEFERRFSLLLLHYDKFGRITSNDVEQLMSSDEAVGWQQQVEAGSSDVLVFGNKGLQVRARTENQRRLVETCSRNDMVFAIGPAGTGKTYTAVALAVRALKNKEVRRIILTRPAVEAGENLGFLPGDLKDKLDPYLQPLYDALRDMLPPQKLLTYIEDGTIEIAPIAFMRGRTLDHAFAILDEAQNATENQMKMFLTRMGRSAKFIITGDVTQIDLPRNQRSGLIHATKILKDIQGIDFIYLNAQDIVRHKLVRLVVDAYGHDAEQRNPLPNEKH
ncbi:MAG TPA: phosphate starvation-inducible protein PhoH [Bacteroidales bacterium]|nr:MAG: phosphate starvation-inducible protein PhoH [Bacteroidetes bacterium GWE2_42_24]OFY27766.1 MAG: phosphate starvation-inducible protein PhoH [Bacteroidetes bacterium GWF2_43_11]HAQ64910.1 phosphate starvation-inducible protein PhoH [Bacteroidales bacterium]HBZ66124.1 phosphate starvation-inducible protein PhoH [Bacteroidales bacterium]